MVSRKVASTVLLCVLLPAVSVAQFQPAQSPVTLPPPPDPIVTDPSTLTAAYEMLVPAWIGAVSPYAYDLFLALAGLEIAVFGWDLWRKYHGDIRVALLETTNKILVIGIGLALLMNGSTWMGYIIEMFSTVGQKASGVAGLGPSIIILQAIKVFGKMLWAAAKAGALADLPTAVVMVLAAFVICFSFLTICAQFIITKVQTFLALGLGFFFLGFGGSRWTIPYVERYFAYAVAVGVKLMALYVLIGAGWSLTDNWIAAGQNAALTDASAEQVMVIMCGAVLYAAVCWHGSSLASQVLSGTPNLSHTEFLNFVGSVVSAGVSTAMVAGSIGAGGAAAAAGAGAKVAASTGSAAPTPTGVTPSYIPPPPGRSGSQGGGAGRAMGAIGQFAQVGAQAIRSAPGGGSHTPPPRFSGFNH